ncbi:MAG: hypothetical protein ACOX6V_05990 [Patescibacteria group bacterium]
MSPLVLLNLHSPLTAPLTALNLKLFDSLTRQEPTLKLGFETTGLVVKTIWEIS